jgi:hypothetical protein
VFPQELLNKSFTSLVNYYFQLRIRRILVDKFVCVVSGSLSLIEFLT